MEVGLIGLLALAVAPNSDAVEWYLAPRLDLKGMYNDNIRLRREDEQSVWAAIGTIGATMGGRTARTEVELAPRLRVSRYTDDTSLDSEDQFLDAHAAHRTERSELGVDGSYTRDTTNVSEQAAEGTGLAFDNRRRVRWDANPYWIYALTPRATTRLGYGHLDVSYQDAEPSRLVDFDFDSVDASIAYLIDERSTFTAGLFASFFEAPDAFNNETDTYGAQVTYSRVLSDRVEGEVILGVQRSKQEFSAAGRSFDEETTGGVGSLSITSAWEKTTVAAMLGRELQPSGRGLVVKRDQLDVAVDHDFTSRLRGRLLVLAFQEDSLEGDAPGIDRDFVRTGARLRWGLNRWWFVQGEYRYTWQKFDDVPGSAKSNAVMLTLGYRGPRKVYRASPTE